MNINERVVDLKSVSLSVCVFLSDLPDSTTLNYTSIVSAAAEHQRGNYTPLSELRARSSGGDGSQHVLFLYRLPLKNTSLHSHFYRLFSTFTIRQFRDRSVKCWCDI